MKRAIALLILVLLGWGTGPISAETLKPGDSLSISVLQDPKLDRTVLVDPNGEIALPLAGRIKARGLTPEAVESILRSRLKDNFKEGRVDVTVAVSATAPPLVLQQRQPIEDDLKPKVFLTGEVAKPGAYVVRQRTTLMQAIALAGGLGPFAAKSRIQVRRSVPGGEGIYPFDYRAYERGANLDSDIVLRTGDVILVPERGFFE